MLSNLDGVFKIPPLYFKVDRIPFKSERKNWIFIFKYVHNE